MDATREKLFRHVLSEYQAMLVRVAASFERDAHERDDLVQEILLALWQSLPTFRGEASLKTFVLSVAYRRCASHIEHAVRRPKGDALDESWTESLADGGPDPETAVSLNQQQERLLAAVRQLPVGQRQLVLLALEGMSYAEIAAIVGITENNVGVRLNRAKAALKAQLED